MSTDIFSRADIQQILSRYYKSANYELLNYSLRPLGEGLSGFLGEHNWLEINSKYQNVEKKILLFTKMQPVHLELNYEYCQHINAFDNEIFFYETLMSEFKQCYPDFDDSIVPKFYFSKNNELVVLENCTDENFVVADTPDVMKIDEIKSVLVSLSKLHATSLIYEEKMSAKLGKTYRLTDNYQQFLQEPFFRGGDEDFLGHRWHVASFKCINAIIDKMPDLDKEEFRTKFHKLVTDCFEIVKPTSKFRNVCCHGDLWRNNVMFKYQNGIATASKLIDFQLMKYNPPVYDVLKFLHQVTSTKMRQDYFDELLWFYYDKLCEELKHAGYFNIISRDQFYASMKYVLPYAKVEALYYYSFQKTGPEYLMNLMSNDKELFKKYAFGDRSFIVPEFYAEGTDYKKWVDEILYEIKDILDNDYFSREDCNVVIKNKLKHTDYKLMKYGFYSLEEKSGFLGMHKKLHITFKNNEKLRFFVKFLPQTQFQEFAIASGAFDNEIFMYEHIFKLMSSLGIKDIYNCVPKSYFTRRNDVVIVEDLNESGFEPIDKHKPLNIDQIKVVIVALAKFHASSLLLEEKMSEKTGEQFKIIENYKNDLKDVCYIDEDNHIGKLPVKSAIKGVCKHIDLFPDPDSTISDIEFKRIVEKIYGNFMYRFSEPSSKFRNVICHGDLWANNILLQYQETEPNQAKFVDFQCIKLCPPAQDLMALIYLTSRKFRANYMQELIQFYYQELSKILSKYGYEPEVILPWTELEESCEFFKTFAMAQTVTHFQFIMAKSEDMAELFNDNQLCYDTFYIDRSEFIEKMCEKNPQYKIVLGECLKDFRVHCENLAI